MDYPLLTNIAISIGSALVGSMVFLQKRSLSADAIAHSLLPGVCLGFLVGASANSIWVLVGGVLSSGLALWIISQISQRTKLDYNSLISIVLSMFYGGGVILFSSLRESGLSGMTSLNSMMFGNAAALTSGEWWVALGVVSLTTVSYLVLRKPIALELLDDTQSRLVNPNARRLNQYIDLILLLNVSIATYATGMILAGAFVIIPAIAARFISKTFVQYILIAILFAVAASLIGLWISAHHLKNPSGPWSVLVLFAMALLSGLASKLFAKARG